MSTPPEVALELERIRSSVQLGFAEQTGRLELLIQRTNQQETTVEALKASLTQLERRTDDRITPLERRQWPLPTAAAVSAVVAAVAAVWPHVAR